MIGWWTLPTGMSEQIIAIPVTRSDFSACVDRCVRALSGTATTLPTRGADASFAQLRRWLRGDLVLADGTPIDLALFDEAILSVNERIAPANTNSLAQLLRASRRLAESIYAKT
jgi:hypothetical protein